MVRQIVEASPESYPESSEVKPSPKRSQSSEVVYSEDPSPKPESSRSSEVADAEDPSPKPERSRSSEVIDTEDLSLSPVLVLQSAARAKLARADAADRRAAAPAEKPAAPPTAPAAPAAAPPAAVDDASAAARIQRSYRGKAARAESAAAGAKAAELEQMYASLGASAVFSMPYLYVQRRHLDETHALLATALGDDAKHTTVEDTRCFVVRPAASHVPNLRDAPPPLGGLVVRRRVDAAAPPPPTPALRLRPTAREAAALARLPRRGCRPTPAELAAIYPRLPAAAADRA